MIDITAERQRLREALLRRADPAYVAELARVMQGDALKSHGVRTPDVRALAGDWAQAHQGVERESLFALVDSLWRGDSYDERSLALELLQRYKRWIPDLTWAHLDRWRRRLDNWGATDGLGVHTFGRWVLADPGARLGHLRDLIADADVWSRRLALVATTWLNRNDDRFADFTLALIDQVKAERHPMITKAVSWALREMTRRHPDRVAAYLDANRDALAALVVREVDNKLRTGLKSGKRRGG